MRFSRFAILIVLSARLFGGCGLFLDLGNPSAASDPVAHGAFVTVRLFNCFGASREGSKAPFPRETAVVSGNRRNACPKEHSWSSIGRRAEITMLHSCRFGESLPMISETPALC